MNTCTCYAPQRYRYRNVKRKLGMKDETSPQPIHMGCIERIDYILYNYTFTSDRDILRYMI